MNFEIIDNAYQVTVLLICMLLSAWLGIRKKNADLLCFLSAMAAL